MQQNGGEDGGGEDQAAKEQEGGGGEADETRHCSPSPIWSRCHCSYQGNTLLLRRKKTTDFYIFFNIII